jgi:energy-coupling factor transporter ATP-binding protein EcfA2
MVSKAVIMAMCAGDSWLDKGASVLLIGGPGGGKTQLASAIGLSLVENGCRVLFTPRRIWCSGSNWRAAKSPWKPPSTGSTASTSSPDPR